MYKIFLTVITVSNYYAQKSNRRIQTADRVLLFNIFPFKLFVHNGANAGVGPDIDRSFNHVDDRIDRSDNAENADIDARHQRECQKITSHRHSGIADGGNNCNKHPEQNLRQSEV